MLLLVALFHRLSLALYSFALELFYLILWIDNEIPSKLVLQMQRESIQQKHWSKDWPTRVLMFALF